MALPDLSVLLTASTEGFETALNRAVRTSATASAQIAEHAGKVSTAYKRAGEVLEAAAAVFAIERFASLIEGSVQAADKLERLAQSTGIAVETLGGLGFAAKLADVDLDSAAAGFVKLDKSIASAAAGNKEATAVYAALGISVRDASGQVKNADQILVEAADKFAGYEDGANKTALALALFGKRGAELIPLLNQGGAAIEANRAYYEKYSSVTAELTRKAAEFEDTQKKISLLSGAFATQLTADLLPAMQNIAGEFLAMKESGDQFKGLADDIAEVLKEVAIGATFAVQGLLEFRNATKELGELAAAVANGTLAEDYSAIIDENEGKLSRQMQQVAALREAINGSKSLEGGIDFGKAGDGNFGKKTQAPNVLTQQAKAAVDPLVAYLDNLNKEGLKLNFDLTNFDRFKGAAGTSKAALVEFDVTLGKFSDDARVAAGLPILTEDQKARVIAAGKAVADYAEKLERVKALHAFDDSVKALSLQASLVGQTNEQVEITTRLFDLEKSGIKAGTDEYAKRVPIITEVVHQLALAQQLQGVKAFSFGGSQSHDEALFQLSMIGKTRDEVQDLTAARQIDLEVQRRAFDETGKQQVSDQALSALQAEAAKQKAQLAIDNTATREAQRSALTGAHDFFTEYVAAATDAATQIKSALTDAFSAIEDHFVQFVQTGKLDFKGLVTSIQADILRIGFKQLTSQGLQALQGLAGADSGIGKVLGGVAGAAGSSGASSSLLGTASSSAALTTFSTTVAAANAPMLLLTNAASAAAGALARVAASGTGSSVSGLAGAAGDSSDVGDFASAFELFSAKGNVFSGGNVLPFARGGVVSSPTLFPMAHGGVGVMGEAGPEAIMPLRRSRNGSLGVAMHGASQPAGPTVHVTQNFAIQPGTSRATQSQIASKAAVGVGRAQRRNG